MGETRMKKESIFLTDTHARVPFSLIGVFLLIGSSVTTVYISHLELDSIKGIASTVDYNEFDLLLQAMEADVGTALNIAGMKGLKKIGKAPIISPLQNTGYGQTSEEINRNRVKEIIMNELNIYLTGRYLYNAFHNGNYAVNVVIPAGKEYPLSTFSDITLQPLNQEFELNRFSLPFIGPETTVTHPLYWLAEVPLTIELRTVNSTSMTEPLLKKDISISSLLTSRYPLLKSLTEEYKRTINGISPLWTYTTVLANIYALVRGYKHYQTGKPLNVVDNRHLALLVNSGLLLEESLVFNSIDPLGIIEFALQAKKTLKGIQGQSFLEVFNTDMLGEGYSINPDDFSQGSANTDAGDDFNQSIDKCLNINLSEIAERILYNISQVILIFTNQQGDTRTEIIEYTGDIEEKIRDKVTFWANRSYILNQTIKQLEKNQTTETCLKDIAPEIYKANLHTTVAEREIVEEHWGDPGDFGNNSGSSPWYNDGFSLLSNEHLKPVKGHVNPGSPLFGETYLVYWWRTHYWYKWVMQNISGNITYKQVWNNVTDTKIETVTLKVILESYARYKGTQDDIVDVFYYNETVDDENLEDTLFTYLQLYPSSDETKQNMICYESVGYSALACMVPGEYRPWILQESWNCLEEILFQISRIQVNPSINATRYPHVGDLFNKAQEDVTQQFLVNMTTYCNLSAYTLGTLFKSVGKKAVYYARDWFVNKIKHYMNSVFSQIETNMDIEIETTITTYASDAGFTAQNVKDTLQDVGETLRHQFTIPFGITMDVIARNQYNEVQWNETVRLAVDHFPNYLNAFNTTEFEGVNQYFLGLKNICTLGPTGFPLLPPSPVTPWLVTLNAWVIQVKGEYATFTVLDSSDEPLFNPLFGHNPQCYVRKNERIWNENGTKALGDNTRLGFEYTTVAFSVVPSWGMMVGDVTGGWEEKHGLS
jgi:hypothetical protein